MNIVQKMDTIQNKERLKITCVERKYKVEKPTFSFVITAKTELDEDSTNRLLQEDIELKTFLENFDIVHIYQSTDEIQYVETDILEPEIVEPEIFEHDIANPDIVEHFITPILETIEPENVKPVIEPDITKTKFESTKHSHKKKYVCIEVSHNTSERRALFDCLDLPDKFTIRNYIDALEKKGVHITNTAMPYDDLNYFEKKEKIKELEKKGHGIKTWKKIDKSKKVSVEREIPIFI